MSHTIVQENFQIRNVTKQLLTKYQIPTKLTYISYNHKNRNFLGMIWKILTNCDYHINLWQGHVSNLLFYFASGELLTHATKHYRP